LPTWGSHPFAGAASVSKRTNRTSTAYRVPATGMPSRFVVQVSVLAAKSTLGTTPCRPEAGRACPSGKTKTSRSTPMTIPASVVTCVNASEAGSTVTERASMPRAIASAAGTRTASRRVPNPSASAAVESVCREHAAEGRKGATSPQRSALRRELRASACSPTTRTARQRSGGSNGACSEGRSLLALARGRDITVHKVTQAWWLLHGSPRNPAASALPLGAHARSRDRARRRRGESLPPALVAARRDRPAPTPTHRSATLGQERAADHPTRDASSLAPRRLQGSLAAAVSNTPRVAPGSRIVAGWTRSVAERHTCRRRSSPGRTSVSSSTAPWGTSP